MKDVLSTIDFDENVRTDNIWVLIVVSRYKKLVQLLRLIPLIKCTLSLVVQELQVLVVPCEGATPAIGFNSLKLFPNPAKDKLLIDFEHLISGTVNISIFDAQEKVVKSITFLNQPAGAMRKDLNVSALPAGNYVIEIKLAGLHKASAKFVKH